MRLVQFQILAALKKSGTLSQVARELYLSQPSISMAIKELEDELGYPILLRSNKGVIFTPRGEWVLERAITIMDAVDELQNNVKEEKWETIRVSVPFHLCNTVLLNAKISLERKYPEFSIWQEGDDDANNVLRRLKQNELDIGIVYTMSLNENQFLRRVNRGECIFHELYQDHACIAARESHPLACASVVSPEDVLHYPYITYRGHLNRFYHQMVKKCNLEPQIIRASDVALIRQMLMSADYVACISHNALNDGNLYYQGKMVPLALPESNNWTFRAGIVYCKPELSPAEHLLVEELSSTAKRYYSTVSEKQ